MKLNYLTLIFLSIFFLSSVYCQTATINGTVKQTNKEPMSFATVQLLESILGESSDGDGNFSINEVAVGEHKIKVSSVGYISIIKTINVTANQTLTIDFVLKEDVLNLNEVVVTGTRTEKRRTDSPVIVNLIDSKKLDQLVAVNLAEGLKFQAGLRVETNCQTCNYTQLRMNGLEGGYSQILINGRSIFSPLTGLYGLEQIPVNMIDRIEVVRGGVSALYGSSAIGGTVNVITKVPTKNEYSISNTFQSIKGDVADNIISANATLVNEKNNAGATFFLNNRKRGAYDANGDNFSEAPQLKDNSFGTNMFFIPKENQKLSLSFSSIYEYRYGGEMLENPAYLATQSEERTHHVLMGSVDYQIKFNEDKNSLIFYYGGQKTDRQHYTGIHPDDSTELVAFFSDPPYGISEVTTHQGGIQLNNKMNRFLGGFAVLTIGAEYIYDDVLDRIDPYYYLIDQTTTNLGVFLQNDWDINKKLNFLTGVRIDKHSLVNHAVISPRLSLLYKMRANTQFRLGWGTGFRAPQAFDTDLHIAFSGGGVSRISLSDQLKEERSNSFTGSVNYDKATAYFIAGFTLEGFYTKLEDSFYQHPIGEDAFGERFEKRNGAGATVQGMTIEARANFDYVVQLEAGFTIQTSKYDKAVENIEGLITKREFLRTPNKYGFATLNYSPAKRLTLSMNVNYTGPMQLIHFGGLGTGQSEDEYYTSEAFMNLGFRVGKIVRFEKTKSSLEIFAGLKNALDSYQDDFDTGKNRDSNYIYGPGLPRTFFIGVRLQSL